MWKPYTVWSAIFIMSCIFIYNPHEQITHRRPLFLHTDRLWNIIRMMNCKSYISEILNRAACASEINERFNLESFLIKILFIGYIKKGYKLVQVQLVLFSFEACFTIFTFIAHQHKRILKAVVLSVTNRSLFLMWSISLLQIVYLVI